MVFPHPLLLLSLRRSNFSVGGLSNCSGAVQCNAAGRRAGGNNTNKLSASNRLKEERRGGENVVILNQIMEEWMQVTGSIIVRWDHQFNGYV